MADIPNFTLEDMAPCSQALRESEARLSALFGGSPTGILVADIETRRFRHANPTICRMLGYSQDELMRLGIEDIVLVLGVALLLSPASYPWYFLWLTPGLLAIRPNQLSSRATPPAWVVLWLGLTPVLHEYMPFFFRTELAMPFKVLPWMIALPVAPLLLAACWARLTEDVTPCDRALAGGG